MPFAGFAAADAALSAAAGERSQPAWDDDAVDLGPGCGMSGAPRESGSHALPAGGPPSETGGAPSEAGTPLGTALLLPPLTSLHMLPATYGELQLSAAVPGCFRVFAGKLGLRPSTPMVHF